MKFKLEVTMGGDAMWGEGDLAALLQSVAAKLSAGRIQLVSDDGSFPSGALRDTNGNKVGEWEVVDADEEGSS